MDSARFHNALRILLSLDGHDLIDAGVVDENWGTPEASERNQMDWFLSDPSREILRMPQANFERLFALIENRQAQPKEAPVDIGEVLRRFQGGNHG